MDSLDTSSAQITQSFVEQTQSHALRGVSVVVLVQMEPVSARLDGLELAVDQNATLAVIPVQLLVRVSV